VSFGKVTVEKVPPNPAGCEAAEYTSLPVVVLITANKHSGLKAPAMFAKLTVLVVGVKTNCAACNVIFMIYPKIKALTIVK
jgi:hypothetical protein